VMQGVLGAIIESSNTQKLLNYVTVAWMGIPVLARLGGGMRRCRSIL
jgi:hypothetical protein